MIKKILKVIIKPSSSVAKFLIFSVIVGIIFSGASGYLEPIEHALSTDLFTFKLQKSSMTLYEFLKICVVLIILFWVASIISTTGQAKIQLIKSIKKSNKELLKKGFQTLVYFFVFMIGLDTLGIDLTTFTVIGGAVGIGLGFGLQKITSNFVSGIMLLFEKSVEEDDLIELSDGILGFVRHIGLRYTLIETFDSKEIMVPNEDFVTNRVINWTFSSKMGRIEFVVGVSYNSDIEKARDLILEAAKEHPRCVSTPEPQCYLREFADSSVNFLLHFWIADVTAGRFEPQSDVMRSIWKKFKENNIEIPFPQRDIHIKTGGLSK